MNRISGLFLLILTSTLSWAQDIEFTYEFEKDNSNPDLVNVTASIINKSGNDIYFLSESCNGLDYYLTTNTTSAEVYINIHCNATYPRKITLKANSTYEFKTVLQVHGNIEKVRLNLELVILLKTSELEGKFVNEIRKENAQRTLNIKGPAIKTE